VTTIAKPHLLSLNLNSNLKKLLNWMAVWLFVANAGFMSLWIVGAPPRYFEIITIALMGLITKSSSYFTRCLFFIAAMVWTTMNFVASIFNLDIPRLLASMKFFLQIQPAASFQYLFVSLGLLGLVAIGLILLRRDVNFSHGSATLIMLGATLGLSATEYNITADMRGHYKRSAPAGAPFSSATAQTGFADRADGKRHLILIMVESWGQPVGNKAMEALMFARYEDSNAVQKRYEVTSGTNPFFGSTTAGEIREMCDRWGDYYTTMKNIDASCLPNKFKKKGYATRAMHSFNGKFFDRAKWYPNIGFEIQEFSEELIANGAEKCGGVFPGACDRDIPAQIGAALKSADQPTFLYWLTVNSHLPVLPDHNLYRKKCEIISPALARDYPSICNQFAVWHDVDKALVKEITSADFPDADILLVGDHMPPFFDRQHRSQVDPAQVPWLYLKQR